MDDHVDGDITGVLDASTTGDEVGFSSLGIQSKDNNFFSTIFPSYLVLKENFSDKRSMGST